MRLSLFPILVAGGLLAAPAIQAQAPAPAPAASVPLGQALEARHLLAHRAAYRLSLSRAREPGNIANAQGAMVYEMVDACDGWASRQRFSLTLTDRDGTEIETASDYSTFETKDGRRLRFTLTQLTQGAVTQRIAGDAELNADGSGVVRYTEPEVKEERLAPGTMLPNAHTIITLNAARRDQRHPAVHPQPFRRFVAVHQIAATRLTRQPARRAARSARHLRKAFVRASPRHAGDETGPHIRQPRLQAGQIVIVRAPLRQPRPSFDQRPLHAGIARVEQHAAAHRSR